jgi:hypothetical protein
MKTNREYESVARIARQGVKLAALFAMMVSIAGTSRAQSQTTASKPAPADAATSAQIAVVDTAKVTSSATATKPTAETAAPAGQVVPKGQQEGIKLHGHWTIEVRNPNGTVASHQEFENSLTGGGALTLISLMLGSSVPAFYEVILEDSSGGGPCQPFPTNTAATYCVLRGSLLSPAPSSFQTAYCPVSSDCLLSVTPNMLGEDGPAGILLSGTTTATESGTISVVATYLFTCTPGTSFTVTTPIAASPSACAGLTSTPSPTNVAGLTQATLPSAVQVTAAGQTIAVTVQISFSST